MLPSGELVVIVTLRGGKEAKGEAMLMIDWRFDGLLLSEVVLGSGFDQKSWGIGLDTYT